MKQGAALLERFVYRGSAALRKAPVVGRWNLTELAGRLVELSGLGASAQLTLAFTQVLEAQRRHEPVVWITDQQSVFFPPDAAQNGVDLKALPVVFVPHAKAAARAADRLARSGAFGLLVLDLGDRGRLSLAEQTRLAGLAKQHDATVLCLTEKPGETPSLGSLVSLRCETRRDAGESGLFRCRIQALKDKRGGPGWSHVEECGGPAGLC